MRKTTSSRKQARRCSNGILMMNLITKGRHQSEGRFDNAQRAVRKLLRAYEKKSSAPLKKERKFDSPDFAERLARCESEDVPMTVLRTL